MLLIRKHLWLLLILFTSLAASAQLQITNSANAQALAQKLVGSGVAISNISFTGTATSAGFFRNFGGNQINLDSGIVLTSGAAQTTTVFGLNGNPMSFASSTINTPGDADLDALVTPNLTEDAVVLEFDFIPLGDTIRFNYVFSSEEYPEWVCSSFNDVFSFFISGPGITGKKNIALVPGTNIPVAINSINSGITNFPIADCNAMGPGSPFTQYFVTNNGTTFTHDGFTTVLTAKSAVTPCQTYHLKIAIADVGDGSYDSGVFIEAESLVSDPLQATTTLPVLNGVPYLVEGCQQGGFSVYRSKKASTPLSVNLSYGGTAIMGTDYQNLPSTVSIPANDSVIYVPVSSILDNIAEGTDTLKVYISSICSGFGNLFQDSVIIQIRDYDTLYVTPQDSLICKNTPVQLSVQGSFTSYQWLPATGLSSPSIGNPLVTLDTATNYAVTAALGTCKSTGNVSLRVKSLELVSKKDVNCKNGTTGQVSVSGGEEWKAPVQYSINGTTYVSDSTFSNLPVGNYTVWIKDATGCTDTVKLSLVQAYADLLVSDSLLKASCIGTNGRVFAQGSGGLAPYTYTVDNNSYTNVDSFVVTGGNHMLYVKDSNGCISSKPVTILNDTAINIITIPSPVLCSGSPAGFLNIDASGGNGQYEYSTDSVVFQQADSFMVTTSSVKIIVRDSKGCVATKIVALPVGQPPFVDAGADTTICEGGKVKFNASFNADTLYWSPSPSLSATNIPNPVASPTQSVTYYVTAEKYGCKDIDTVTVAVWPAPVANAGSDTTICFGQMVPLSGSGGASYLWTPNLYGIDAGAASSEVMPDKTVSYYLQAIDANGCKSLSTDTVTINVTPPLVVFAGQDTAIVSGQALQLLGVDVNGAGATQFQWSPPTGLSDPTIINPVVTLNAGDITYTLTLTTDEGCKGTDVVKISVYQAPEIYVPTGFTPNGDGRNDLLRALPVGIKEFKYFKVFNRWGQMIYTTANERMGWDGKVNGVAQPTSTFVWIAEGIDFKGNKVFRKGSSTLIR